VAGPPALPKDTLPERLPLDTIPLGLPAGRPVPKDNPLTEAKVRLGRRLFFDPLLSGDGTVSCASCHRPEHGFAGPEPRAAGAGRATPRRCSTAPSAPPSSGTAGPPPSKSRPCTPSRAP